MYIFAQNCYLPERKFQKSGDFQNYFSECQVLSVFTKLDYIKLILKFENFELNVQ